MTTSLRIPNQRPSVARRSARRRWLFRGIYVAYVGLLLVAAERAYWWLGFGVKPLETLPIERVWELYYPELNHSGALRANPRPDDGRIDILLLGASVIHQIAKPLETALRQRLGTEVVQVYNLAKPAHTSRDSYYKSLRLSDRPFDLYVYYDAINDVRMNACPPDQFRSDYTHCALYASFDQRLRDGRVDLTDVIGLKTGGLIDLGVPYSEWIHYGATIRTAEPYRANLAAILGIATSHRSPTLLISFAYHLSDDYSKDAFLHGQLDYGPGEYTLPIEIRGLPENVRRGIDVHNRVVRALAEGHPYVGFVDQERLLERSGRIFSDPCHLTEEGIAEFVANLLPEILRLTEGRAARHPPKTPEAPSPTS